MCKIHCFRGKQEGDIYNGRKLDRYCPCIYEKMNTGGSHKMNAIHGKLQPALVKTDKDKNKIMNVVRKTRAERRKISLLKDVKIRKRLEVKLI